MNNGQYYPAKSIKWSPESIIKDALNQFWQFNLIKSFITFDDLKNEWIPLGKLVSLKEYISRKYGENDVKIIEIINNFNPEIFEKYDLLIDELKSPGLESKRVSEILNESMMLI